MDPRNLQVTDIARIDLVEGAEVVRFVGAVIGQPIIGGACIDQRGLDRLGDRAAANHETNRGDGEPCGFTEHRFPLL